MTTQRERLAAIFAWADRGRHDAEMGAVDAHDLELADLMIGRGVRVLDPFPSPGAKVQVERIAAAVSAMFDAWTANERAHAGEFLYSLGVRVLGPTDPSDLGTTRIVDRYLGDPPADLDEPGAAAAHYADACDVIRWLLDERTRLLDVQAVMAKAGLDATAEVDDTSRTTGESPT